MREAHDQSESRFYIYKDVGADGRTIRFFGATEKWAAGRPGLVKVSHESYTTLYEADQVAWAENEGLRQEEEDRERPKGAWLV